MTADVTSVLAAGRRGPPEELEQRLAQQALVAEFGRFALRNPGRDQLLDEVCRVVAEGLGVRFAKVLEFRRNETDFLLSAGVGWEPELIGRARLSADPAESPAGQAFATGASIISNDLPQETRFRMPPLLVEHGVVRAVNVIIQGDGEPFGVLEADARKPGAFSEHDVDFLQALANTLGLAIETERALSDRRMMAREIDHRIKNSLMLVSSVLAMQQRAAPTPEAKMALSEAADRVTTIARIHDQLHRSATADRVEFGAYLRALAADLVASLAREDADLQVEAEAVELSSELAAPLGLIASELVMNALKHARRPGGRSVLRVSFARRGDELELVIADDGPGLPPDFDPTRGKGLGMRLVVSLAQQIEGRLEAGNAGGGARFVLRCPA